MMRRILLLFGFLQCYYSFAQNTDSSNSQSLYLSGYIKNDFFWDSRQTISAREGSFLLWPSAKDEDIHGNDINAVTNFNFLSLQSRLSFNWKGTEALGAKIGAKIEGDFFAQSNDNINLFRLRHAYIKMNWEHTELLVGQYWIPMFTTACFPGTVSFNTGTPFNPFGRNPQIKISHSFNKVKLSAVAHSQRDYTSRGPNGVSGEYLRNTAIPEFTGMIDYKFDRIAIGLGVAFKQIIPQLKTDQNFATHQNLNSYSAYAFLKYKVPKITFKIKGIYGQNIPDYLSVGGFAVTQYDVLPGRQEYEPISSISTWTDISSNGKKWQIGVFGGYTQNLGTNSAIAGDIYGLGTNIESLYRISPRLIFNSGKIQLASELEYTTANYGTSFDSKNVAITTESVSNLRILFAVYYFFDTRIR
jgi:hypothetical protein